MQTVGIWLRIFCLLIVIFPASLSSAQSQDLFREMDQLKQDLSALKNEVDNLRNLVYELRSAALKSATPQEQRPPETPPSPQEPAVKPQESAADDQEITKTVCPAVGKFFSEADASLGMSDPSAAQDRMRAAFKALNATLQNYAQTHRVSKLLNIYQGIAWDTYVAVELRGAIQGNQDFLETLERHKRKYAETCPKQALMPGNRTAKKRELPQRAQRSRRPETFQTRQHEKRESSGPRLSPGRRIGVYPSVRPTWWESLGYAELPGH